MRILALPRQLDGKTLSRLTSYVLGTAVMKGAMFLFIPIVAEVLSRDDVSKYGLYTSALSLYLPFVTQNVYIAGDRLAFDYAKSPQLLRSFNITVLLATLSMTAISALLLTTLILCMQSLGSQTAVSVGGWESISLFGAIAFGTAGTTACQTVMRVNGQAGTFAFTSSLRIVISMAFFAIFYFISQNFGSAMNFNLLLLSFCLGSCASFVLALILTRRDYIGGRWKTKMYIEAWKLSAPTSVHHVVGTLSATGGRWIGALFLSLGELAEYSLINLVFLGVSGFAKSCIEARRPNIMRPFANGEYREGSRQAWKATILAVLMSVSLYMIFWGYLAVFANYQIGSIKISHNAVIVMSIAGVFDALYLYGIATLIGIKRSRDPMFASFAVAVLSLAVAWVCCLISSSSMSLLVSMLITSIAQFLMFFAVAELRLRQHSNSIAGKYLGQDSSKYETEPAG